MQSNDFANLYSRYEVAAFNLKAHCRIRKPTDFRTELVSVIYIERPRYNDQCGFVWA